jgi:hypothetical protein
MSNAAVEEPKPIQTEDSEPVLSFVLKTMHFSGRHFLGADLEARAKLGMERYGTPLMTHNGRDPLADLYQELLDALMYLGQYMLESGKSDCLEFSKLLKLTIAIKLMMSGNPAP